MRALSRPILLAAVFLLSACATKPPASDPEALAEFNETNDPLEPTNRVLYAVNNGIDTVLLRPLAVGYRYVVPEVVRGHIHNVLTNLTGPVRLANDMMQAKPRRAGDSLMRILVNSTVGVAGIFDVATDWGWPAHDSDYGMTLALWGLPEGPFLFLPVLGPSNPRDTVGFGTDLVIDPAFWVGNGATVTALGWSRFAVSGVDQRERALDDIDKIKAQALDPYATFRSLYRQNRQAKIDETRSDERRTVPIWFPQPAASEPQQ
jgi:phospholipid-binding lipoprotein MlaA